MLLYVDYCLDGQDWQTGCHRQHLVWPIGFVDLSVSGRPHISDETSCLWGVYQLAVNVAVVDLPLSVDSPVYILTLSVIDMLIRDRYADPDEESLVSTLVCHCA